MTLGIGPHSSYKYSTYSNHHKAFVNVQAFSCCCFLVVFLAAVAVVVFTQVTNLLAPPPCRHITTSNLTYAVRSTRIAGTRSHTAAARRCDAASNADTVADIALRTRAAAADDTWTSCHRYIHHFASGRAAKYCDERVCLSVCLSTSISRKRRGQTSQSSVYMLPSAVTPYPLATMQYVMHFRFCG